MATESKKSSLTGRRLSGDGKDTKQRVLDALHRPENACCTDCNAPSPKCDWKRDVQMGSISED